MKCIKFNTHFLIIYY